MSGRSGAQDALERLALKRIAAATVEGQARGCRPNQAWPGPRLIWPLYTGMGDA